MHFHDCSSKEELKYIWSEMYKSHLNECDNYFKGREFDFLKFNLDIDTPNKICSFFKESYPNLDEKFWIHLGKTNKNN